MCSDIPWTAWNGNITSKNISVSLGYDPSKSNVTYFNGSSVFQGQVNIEGSIFCENFNTNLMVKLNTILDEQIKILQKQQDLEDKFNVLIDFISLKK